MADNSTRPTDAVIARGRDRTSRAIVLSLYIITSVWIFSNGVQWLGEQFFPDIELLAKIFWGLGFAMALGIVIYTVEKWFIIRNPTIGMFVTQDTFASLFGAKNVNVPYGPGTHISYPWERRLGQNNISLEEAPNNFDFIIQCSDGIINGKGSFRLRPDQMNPVTFLGSVSAVADDITDLIVGEIVAQFKDKTVKAALDNYSDLNQHLDETFRLADTDVEKRCGIRISDVTIRELLPTADMQKTMSAIGEATAIARGTEIILGMTKDEIKAEIAAGRMTQADVNLARDRFLSISGNLDGMQIKRSEFDVSVHGIDSEAIRALAELAKTPAVQAAATTATKQRTGNKPKGKTP
jgi:hypothetical protein